MTDQPPEMSPALRWILAEFSILLGGGYLLGPAKWSSSASFTVIHQLGVPIPLWGGMFVVGGLLLLFRREAVGHSYALAAYLFWGLCLAATLFEGLPGAWGAPCYPLALAMPLHALALIRRRRRKQRR